MAIFFSFTHKGKYYEKNVSFKELLNFTEVVSLIADQLLAETPTPDVYTAIKYLFDRIGSLHTIDSLNVLKPRYFKVEITLDGSRSVDVRSIHEYLLEQSLGHPVSFTLLIISEDKRWKIPWQAVKDLKSMELDSKWDRFVV